MKPIDQPPATISEADTPTLKQIVREALPSTTYELDETNVQKGGTRLGVPALFGDHSTPNEAKEKRIAIIDGTPTSPNAKKNSANGKNTSNEFMVSTALSTTAALAHHISPVLESRVHKGHTINVQPFVGNTSLFDAGQLEPRHTSQLLEEITDAALFMKKKGFYHCDISPFNVRIQNEELDFATYLTDLANAILVKTAQSKEASFQPSMGTHWVSDPTKYGVFTGKKSNYDDQSVIYEIATTTAFAAIGSFGVEYNPNTKTSRSMVTQDPLLTDNQFDPKKHNKAIDLYLKKLPRKLKKIKPILQKALSGDINQRYSSLEEFAQDIQTATRPSLLKRRAGIITKIAALVALPLTIAAASLAFTQNAHLQEQLQTERETVHIKPVQSGRGLTVTAPGLEQIITIYDRTENEPKVFNKNTYQSRKITAVKLQQGDLVHPNIKVEYDKPNTLTANTFESRSILSTLGGQAYLEGLEPDDFTTHPKTTDTQYYGLQGRGYYNVAAIRVPKNLPDAVYTLVSELNAPLVEDKKSRYKFAQPGGIFLRSRAPVIVGNPDIAVWVSDIYLSPLETSRLHLAHLGDNKNGQEYQVKISIPEFNYTHEATNKYDSEYDYVAFHPRDTSIGNALRKKIKQDINIHYHITHNEKTISKGIIPVVSKPIFMHNSDNQKVAYYQETLSIPPTDFAERLIDFHNLPKEK